MKKKSILAILMTGLMLATVFSALSMSAASCSQEQLPSGAGTLKVYVYKDENENGIQDEGERGVGGALVNVQYFGDVLLWTATRTAGASGVATVPLRIFYRNFVTVVGVFAVSGNWICYDFMTLITVYRGETETISIGLHETESIPPTLHLT